MPDYTVGDTVYKRFTTRAFATGVPTTLAGTPVVSAYEDDSAVQITAGITLGVDHDTVTGLNLLTIVATGANGFEAGKSYDLVITTGTVGGVSVVGEVVWHFTLSAEAAAVDLANGTDGLGAIKAETAAILTDTAEIGAAGAGLTNINLPDQTMNITGNITGNLSGSVGSVTGAVGSVTASVTINAASVDAIWDETLTAHVTADSAAVAVKDILADTADMQPKLGTPAADVSADIAAVKSDTAAILTDTGTTLPATLAALNDLSAAQVNAEMVDVMNVDTITLPGQAAPPLAPTHRQAIGWLYKAFRNRKTQTATQWSLLADDETTVDAKATVSDDGTTAIKQEIVTGP